MKAIPTRPAPPGAKPPKAASVRYVPRLYVAGLMPKSIVAIANMKRICEENLHGRYELEVHGAIMKVIDMVSRLRPALRGILVFFLFSALMFFEIHASLAAEQIPVKRVLVVYGFNPDFPAHQLFTQGLQSVFGQSPDRFEIKYSFEYLDLGLARADEEYRTALAGVLKRKYLLRPKPDLIVAHLTPANSFLVKYGEEIMPGVPVVLSGDQSGMIPLENISSNYTAIVRESNPAPAVSLILQAQPETKKIYIVMGDSPQEQETRSAFTKDLASFSDKVEMVYLNHLPFPQMMEVIKGISGPSAILYISFFQDVAKNNFVAAQVAGIISRTAHVPTYGMSALYLGQGVVGGYQFSAGIVGEKAAELGAQILLGRSVSDFPREQTAKTAEYRFDWRALKRFGIDERRLPRESKFEYRVPTFWEAYKWYVVGGSIVLIVETLLVVGLLINISRRKQLGEALRASEEKFAKAFRASPVLVAISTVADGRFVDVNERFLRTSGYTRDEVIGRTAQDISLWKTFQDRQRLIESLHKNNRISGFEAELCKKSGESVTCEIWAEQIVINDKPCVLWVSHDITERKQAEANIARLTDRVLGVQEAERGTLARELHDEFGQVLTAVKLQLQSQIKTSPSSRLEDSAALVDELLRQVKSLSLDLRPAQLDEAGLAAALQSHVGRLSRHTGRAIGFECAPDVPRVTGPYATACFRVVQEAVTNALRHSGAEDISVRLERNDDFLCVIVCDNGSGFDAASARTAAARRGSMGLYGMEDRVGLIGGTLEVRSAAGAGTEVTVRVPMKTMHVGSA